MRCVVTGSAGFVGSSIAERLIADGHSVIGIDCFVDYYPREMKLRNLERLRQHARFQFIEENLLSLDLVRTLEGAEWVFHEAAQAGVRASWGKFFETYTSNNVLATQRLLEACCQCSTLKRVVYASSSSVYGNAERFPTSESDLPQPVSPYGVTKLAAEHLMSLYASQHGLPTVSLRYFTVYGPRQRPDMAFRKFITAALKGDEFELYGDGEQSRDFTYIDDIVQGNILAAERGPAGGVFNLGGGSVITVNQVLSVLEEVVGKFKVKRMERQRGDARHTSADTSRARAQLGYEPRTTLSEGLRREAAWLEEVLRATRSVGV